MLKCNSPEGNMYKAITIAKYIIKRCNENSIIISNLKLQKILYFIQAEFLVVTDSPCFQETIEAWDFGPVVPEVYYEYRMYGSASIPCEDYNEQFMINPNDIEMINGIIDECAQFSAYQLVNITHKQDPWINAYRSWRKMPISNESIKEFFKK